MRKLRTKHKRFLAGLIALVFAGVTVAFIASRDFAVLDAQGQVAREQRDLLVFATALSLLVVIPVFVMVFYIVWKYRAHKQSKYTPDWDHNRKLETLWWGIPTAIILVLSIITWQSSHALDPSKPLVSDKSPVTVQVVAMQWKWLFIYPEQGVASVNYLQFPVDTPVNFQITSDGPMNSFWIPQLGGQIYAMTGMSTKLHLMADRLGTFDGSSANLSGEGFAGMRFKAQATTTKEFDSWIGRAKGFGNPVLDADSYQSLAKPSTNNPPAIYSLRDRQLYDTVVNKYMSHGAEHAASY